MKKHFFLFPWNLDHVEEKLHDLELQGYRLVRVEFPHIFLFVKAKPRDARYIFAYSFLKEYGLLAWRSVFLSDLYNGIEIPCIGPSSYSVFKIIDQADDLQAYFDERIRYIRHSLWQKTLLSSVFLMLFLFAVICNNSLSVSLFSIYSAGTVISGIQIVYYLVCLLKI